MKSKQQRVIEGILIDKMYRFIFVALAERILLDCHDILVVGVDFVALELRPDASDAPDVVVVADVQALNSFK